MSRVVATYRDAIQAVPPGTEQVYVSDGFNLGDSVTGGGAPLYFDDFESRDMSYNEGGFDWKSLNRTTLVIGDGADDNYVVFNTDGEVMIGPTAGRQWENGPDSGTCAMRFRYPAGQSMAEQRWSITGALTEFWHGWWWRVPINFVHPGGNNNQKLCALWMDDYEGSGTGPTFTSQFRDDGGSGSRLYCYHYGSEGAGHSGETGQVGGSSKLITHPTDQGRWMHLLWYVRCATDSETQDGIGRIYRRWEGESTYELLWEDTDMITHVPSGLDGFLNGYMMGWANATYSADTEFLADSFKIWDSDPGLV